MFLNHVKTVGSFVSKKGKIPLIWDDMLRNMPRSDIQEWFRQSILNTNLELVFIILPYSLLFNKLILLLYQIIIALLIQNSGIGSIVEVMVWSYTEDIDRYLLAMVLVVQLISIDRFLGHDTWRMYAQLFRGVWAASAFKVGNMI